jgi:hypothetical protein
MGSLVWFTCITSVFGVFALFGAEVIQWNGSSVTGIPGLISAPFIGICMGIVIGGVSALFTAVGLRIYALFHDISIEYIPCGESTDEDIFQGRQS